MKLRFWATWALVAINAGSNAFAAEVRSPLRLGWDPWCPHTCADLARPGYMVEIVQAIYAGSPFIFESKSQPWNTSLTEARYGRIEGVLGALRSDAEDFLFPKFEIGHQVSCYYRLKSNALALKSLADLPKDKKVGIVKDYAYGNPADEWIKSNEARVLPFFGVDTFARLLKALINQSVEVIIEDRAVANYAFSNEALREEASQIEEFQCQTPVPLYVAFSPARGNSAAAAAMRYFDREFPKFRESRIYKEILKKYGVKP